MVSEMSGVAAAGRLWGMDYMTSVLLAALLVSGHLAADDPMFSYQLYKAEVQYQNKAAGL